MQPRSGCLHHRSAGRRGPARGAVGQPGMQPVPRLRDRGAIAGGFRRGSCTSRWPGGGVGEGELPRQACATEDRRPLGRAGAAGRGVQHPVTASRPRFSAGSRRAGKPAASGHTRRRSDQDRRVPLRPGRRRQPGDHRTDLGGSDLGRIGTGPRRTASSTAVREVRPGSARRPPNTASPASSAPVPCPARRQAHSRSGLSPRPGAASARVHCEHQAVHPRLAVTAAASDRRSRRYRSGRGSPRHTAPRAHAGAPAPARAARFRPGPSARSTVAASSDSSSARAVRQRGYRGGTPQPGGWPATGILWQAVHHGLRSRSCPLARTGDTEALLAPGTVSFRMLRRARAPGRGRYHFSGRWPGRAAAACRDGQRSRPVGSILAGPPRATRARKPAFHALSHTRNRQAPVGTTFLYGTATNRRQIAT